MEHSIITVINKLKLHIGKATSNANALNAIKKTIGWEILYRIALLNNTYMLQYYKDQ